MRTCLPQLNSHLQHFIFSHDWITLTKEEKYCEIAHCCNCSHGLLLSVLLSIVAFLKKIFSNFIYSKIVIFKSSVANRKIFDLCISLSIHVYICRRFGKVNVPTSILMDNPKIVWYRCVLRLNSVFYDAFFRFRNVFNLFLLCTCVESLVNPARSKLHSPLHIQIRNDIKKTR